MMKKLYTLLMLLCFITCIGMADLSSGLLSDKIYAVDFEEFRDGKTSRTLNHVISLLGSEPRILVINGGEWTITNNVTIPTNIYTVIQEGSSLSLQAGTTVTVGEVWYDIVSSNLLYNTLNPTSLYPYLDIDYRDDATGITYRVTNDWNAILSDGMITIDFKSSTVSSVYASTNVWGMVAETNQGPWNPERSSGDWYEWPGFDSYISGMRQDGCNLGTGRITCQTTGWYQVGGFFGVDFDASVDGNAFFGHILKNSTASGSGAHLTNIAANVSNGNLVFLGAAENDDASDEEAGASGSGYLYLEATDYISIYITHGSGWGTSTELTGAGLWMRLLEGELQ